MNDWKYCPHCGKELMSDAPKPQGSEAPPFPWNITQTNDPWSPNFVGVTTTAGPLPK